MADKNTTEAALVRAMQRGEETALEAVIEQYTPYVSALVWNIVCGTLDRSDAAALVSDVFYTLWINAKKVQHGKLKGYLCSIARSKALNALRGKSMPRSAVRSAACPSRTRPFSSAGTTSTRKWRTLPAS